MHSFVIGNSQEMPSSTVFVEDIDVIPTTSSFSNSILTQQMTPVAELSRPLNKSAEFSNGIDMNSFVKDFFAADSQLLQSKEDPNVNFFSIFFHRNSHESIT